MIALGEDTITGTSKTGRVSKITGTSTTRDVFNFGTLSKDELESFSIIQGGIAIAEEKAEQRDGNLLSNNLWVDTSLKKHNVGAEYKVKFGGKIRYVDIFSVTEVMEYITKQVRAITQTGMKVKTGAFESSFEWMLDGKVIRPPYTNVNLKKGSQLVYFNAMPYAKYWEFGTKRTAKELKFMKLAAGRANRRFFKGFRIFRKLLTYGELPASSKTKQLMRLKYASQAKADFYAQRWANSYPAVQITLRHGVKNL